MAKNNKKNEARETWIAFAIFLVIVAVIACVIVFGRSDDAPTNQREPMSTEFMEKAPPCPFEIENFETVAGCPLGKLNDDLSLTCAGRFGDTLAVIVQNVGEQMVEFAEVKINYGGMDAFFEITDLPAGGSMLSVEREDLLYAENMEFKTPLLMGYTPADESIKTAYSADFDVSVDGGILTLENCSGRDFQESVEIRCKQILQDGLYFGTTEPLATEGLFSNGESRYFDFTPGMQIVCLRYTD